VTTTRIEKLDFYPTFLLAILFFLSFSLFFSSVALFIDVTRTHAAPIRARHTLTYLGPLAHFPSAFALIVVAFLPVHRLFDPVARLVRYSGSIRVLTVHVSPLHRCAKWKKGGDVFKNLNNVKYLRADL